MHLEKTHAGKVGTGKIHTEKLQLASGFKPGALLL